MQPRSSGHCSAHNNRDIWSGPSETCVLMSTRAVELATVYERFWFLYGKLMQAAAGSDRGQTQSADGNNPQSNGFHQWTEPGWSTAQTQTGPQLCVLVFNFPPHSLADQYRVFIVIQQRSPLQLTLGWSHAWMWSVILSWVFWAHFVFCPYPSVY